MTVKLFQYKTSADAIVVNGEGYKKVQKNDGLSERPSTGVSVAPSP